MAEPPTLSAPAYLELLPGTVVAKIRRLEFLARAKMQGSLTGRHTSPNKGASVEFAEHRAYVKGDNLRDLDWRILGKSDRYYVKQYIEETNLRATIVLDASGSMGYGAAKVKRRKAQAASETLTKFQYGRLLAAALAHFMIQQQDGAGLVVFDTEVRTYLPPAAKPSQTRRILQELHEAEPGSETRLSDVLHEVAERIPKRGVVVLISDLFGDTEQLVHALHHFRYHGHETSVFHVMAEDELTFPFKNPAHFRDLENLAADYKIDPSAIRGQYLEQVRVFLESVRKQCEKMGVDYRQLSTAQSYEEALAQFLAKRRRK